MKFFDLGWITSSLCSRNCLCKVLSKSSSIICFPSNTTLFLIFQITSKSKAPCREKLFFSSRDGKWQEGRFKINSISCLSSLISKDSEITPNYDQTTRLLAIVHFKNTIYYNISL